MRIESSGKPDAWKLARPVWGWGRGETPRPTPPEGSDPSDNGIVEIPDGRGGTRLVTAATQLARVVEYPVLPWRDMSGTETNMALKAAGLDWGAEAGIATETQAARGLQSYSLRIDGQLLRNQRQLLLKLVDAMAHGSPCNPLSENDRNLFEGVIELLNSIADQAHDRHSIDCLLVDEDDTRCECEKQGFFFSGIPGILAHMENGRLAKDAKVNRCDLCQRYPSDAAAFEKLRELDRASS